jgi:GT2 family glycosyltransferase
LKTTILLLSLDEGHLLERSLTAALAQPDAEVVVLDNASRDDTGEVADKAGVRCVRLHPQRSYAAAINSGLAGVDGDAVLLLNADCFLEPGFLEAAIPHLDERGVGSVAPKLLRTRGPAPDEQLELIDAAGMYLDRRRKNGLVGHGDPAGAFEQRGEAFGVDGAAALYRRDALEDCAVDGEVLDEDMELWASDVDLAWRARLRGWRCVYEPAAIAHHVRTYSPTTRAQVAASDRRLQFRNRLLMVAKNDSLRELAPDAHRLLAYELLAFGHALLRERELLGGYREALRLLPAARRRRRSVQARRRVARVPLGLMPPAA